MAGDIVSACPEGIDLLRRVAIDPHCENFSRVLERVDCRGEIIGPKLFEGLMHEQARGHHGSDRKRDGLEGESYGPYTDALKEMTRRQGDIRYDIVWDFLGGFLETRERRGIS